MASAVAVLSLGSTQDRSAIGAANALRPLTSATVGKCVKVVKEYFLVNDSDRT